MGTHMISQSARKRGSRLYALLKPLAILLKILICSCRVYGLENVPAEGPLLIVVNHLSWYDPLLFCALFKRRIWFVAKKEIFSWPIIDWLVRSTGQIAIERGEQDRAALTTALAYLQAGCAVVLFPEGTVERQEQMIAAHPGVAMLALRSGATIQPVAHTGTRKVLRTRRDLRPRVTVRIGKPYTPLLQNGTSRKENLQAVTNEMMQQIASLLPEESRGVYR